MLTLQTLQLLSNLLNQQKIDVGDPQFEAVAAITLQAKTELEQAINIARQPQPDEEPEPDPVAESNGSESNGVPLGLH
jgi:dsDNA-binding SOS-regulon protein